MAHNKYLKAYRDKKKVGRPPIQGAGSRDKPDAGAAPSTDGAPAPAATPPAPTPAKPSGGGGGGGQRAAAKKDEKPASSPAAKADEKGGDKPADAGAPTTKG